MHRSVAAKLALFSVLFAGGCAQEIPESESEDVYEYDCGCSCVCVNHMLKDECTFEVDTWSCQGECSAPSCGSVCDVACEEVVLEDGGTYFCNGVELANGTCEER